jgi:hypothetical protein
LNDRSSSHVEDGLSEIPSIARNLNHILTFRHVPYIEAPRNIIETSENPGASEEGAGTIHNEGTVSGT